MCHPHHTWLFISTHKSICGQRLSSPSQFPIPNTFFYFHSHFPYYPFLCGSPSFQSFRSRPLTSSFLLIIHFFLYLKLTPPPLLLWQKGVFAFILYNCVEINGPVTQWQTCHYALNPFSIVRTRILWLYILSLSEPFRGMPHLHFVLPETMCKGVGEGRNHAHGGFRQFPPVMCELCNSKASLYCQADDAYLCRKCDKWVHCANFLAQRHIRCILCKTCQNLTQKYLMATSTELLLPTILTSTQQTHSNNANPNKCCSLMLTTPFLFL